MSEVKTCSKYCYGCAFQQAINGGARGASGYLYCAYLFMTKKRRPCPAGDGCTAKISPAEWRKSQKFKTQEEYEKYWSKVREQRRIAKMKWYNKNKDEINAKLREKRRLAREG